MEIDELLLGRGGGGTGVLGWAVPPRLWNWNLGVEGATGHTLPSVCKLEILPVKCQ